MPTVNFTVPAGATLGGIAKKFGVPLGVLIDTNGITDPNKIKVGQVLKIPASTTDAMDHPEVSNQRGEATPIPGDLKVNQTKFRLPLTLFKNEEQEKDLIVLHYTAGGSARSAFDTWVQAANQVATAYVVDLDGTIYELFDPRCWAFHLGLTGAAAAGHKHHRRSIGIEIVNAGVLKPAKTDPEQLNWWPNDFGTKFCKKSETARYVAKSFRRFDFHAAYPEVQLEQSCKLVRHLCERFNIPKTIPPADKLDAFDLGFATGFSGVISHQSFRSDKFDVGPAFDWSRLFNG